MKYDLAIIFPCYNERQRATKTFESYLSYLQKTPEFAMQKIGIIFVDDGSSDDTLSLLKEFALQSTDHITIEALGYKDNLGKGGAIKFALKNIESTVYGFVDADNSFKAESLPGMLEALETADFVLAQGAGQGKKTFYEKLRGLFSGGLKKISNFFIGIPNIDTQRGFKFFNQKVVDLAILPTIEDRFAFDLEVIARARAAKLKLAFVEVEFEHDARSTVTWRDGVRYLFDVLAIADRVRTAADKRFWFNLSFVVLLMTMLLFGWTLYYGYFFSDDFTWIWHGQRIGWSLNGILHTPMSSFFSPMLNLFYVTMFSLFGFGAAWYYLFGLGLHFCNAMLAGYLAWQLEKSRLLAVIVALLVTGAGGAYEPLVWLAANMHPWVAMWMLLALVTLIAYHQGGKIRYLFVSLLATVGAFYTKEVAIVLPALIFVTYVFYFPTFRQRLKSPAHLLWGGAFSYACLWYAYNQYMWQKSSVWVAERVWGLSWQAVLKAPIVAIDLFLPQKLFAGALNQAFAYGLLLVSLLVTIWLLRKFWSLPMVRWGLVWIYITMAPTIFFFTTNFWDPLASRYTYLPRIGLVMILAAILHFYITKNKSPKIVNWLVGFIIVISSLQIVMMLRVVKNEYLFVYSTGRTLVSSLETVKACGAQKLLVRPGYPFGNNNAHLVGAASTVAGIKEAQVVFMVKNSKVELRTGEAELWWRGDIKEYQVKCQK